MSTPPVLRLPQDPSQIPPALAALLAPTANESEPLFAGTPIPGPLKGMLPPSGAEEKIQASNSPVEGLDAPRLAPATTLPDALKPTLKSYLKSDGSLGQTTEGYDNTPLATPTFDKGGFLTRLGRIAGGFFGMTPPGAETGDSKIGSTINRVVGGLGNTMTAIGGTPQERGIAAEERQIPLKMAQLNNELQYRRGILGIGQQNANSKSATADVAQQKADQQHQALVAQMKLKGEKEDPSNPGSFIPMTPEERLNDLTVSLNDRQKEALVMATRSGQQLKEAQLDAMKDPTNTLYQNKLRAADDIHSKALANIAYEDKLAETMGQRTAQGGQRVGLSTAEQAQKIWEPAQASAERYTVMQDAYTRALHGDQQAMLNLLANHLGMTMGLQKGARLNQALIQEAQQSLPWLQGLKARFDKDGYLTGVVLSPDQMRQMVDLGAVRYQGDVQKARNQSEYFQEVSGQAVPEPHFPIDPDTLQPLPSAPPRQRVGEGRVGNTPVKLGGGATQAQVDAPILGQVATDHPNGGSAPTKIATAQHVADYAKQKGITTQQATKEFADAGYAISR